MSIKKFLFVDSDGIKTESEGGYETIDFINVSTGITDADKPIKLDSAGLLDYSILNIDSNAAIIKGSSGGLKINTDDSSLQSNSNILKIKDLGVKNNHIDFGLTSNQINASIVPIIDTANKFMATNIEDALLELINNTMSNGVDYTVGAGGVTKGDLVYISANNTVVKYSNIQVFQMGIGIAKSTQSAGQTVKILKNDSILDGYNGLIAGTRYFWKGNTFTTDINSFSKNDYIWCLGVAKNATEAHIDVEFLYRK